MSRKATATRFVLLYFLAEHNPHPLIWVFNKFESNSLRSAGIAIHGGPPLRRAIHSHLPAHCFGVIVRALNDMCDLDCKNLKLSLSRCISASSLDFSLWFYRSYTNFV